MDARHKAGHDENSGAFNAFDIVAVPLPRPAASPKSAAPPCHLQSQARTIWPDLVTMITSADNAPWSCDVTIADLARAGLPAPSVLRTAKIACIEPARIDRAGKLDKATTWAVGRS